MSNSVSNTNTPREIVSGYALRILSKLDCKSILQDAVEELIERADSKGLLTTGNPKHLAGGIVYIAGILEEERMTLDTIGGVIGASGNTVGRYYLAIARGLGYSER